MHIDSVTVRQLAEYASSLRAPGGEDAWLITTRDAEGGGDSIAVESTVLLPCSDDNRVATPVNTAVVQPNRLGVSSVTIQAAGMEGSESLSQYDAVFWTEAAVEKFLFPYYASVYGWDAAQILQALAKAFYGYVPGVEEPPPPPVVVPFAVAHIPRSDYVMLDEGGGGGGGASANAADHLVLLILNEAGEVEHRRLSEYL